MLHARRLILLAAVLGLLGLGAGGCSLKDKIMRHLGAQDRMALSSDPANGRWDSQFLTVKRLWPTTKVKAQVFKGNFWASPVLAELPGQPPVLVVLPSSGSVAGLAPESGKLLWELEPPHSATETPELRAAPLLFGDNLMVVYTTRDRKSGAVSHRAFVVDLRRGKANPQFQPIIFAANAPAAGGGSFPFDPQWQLPRAVTHGLGPGLGKAYVTFGADRDQGSWHGWLFEVDLDAWSRGALKQAISAAFSTTSEAECDDGTNGELCGGGLWAYGGPQVYGGPDGDEIMIQTGNGRLDLARRSYSQSLLRLRPGLKFNPGCDALRCRADNQRDPSSGCLSTCRDLFVPRLSPSEAPLRPADHSCDGLSYMACLELKDWDLGSVSPVRVEVGGKAYYVTAGKAGDVFLIDGDRLGILHDRKMTLDLCGAEGKPCPEPNAGLVITQPLIVTVDGAPLVVLANFNPDDIHSSGVTAYRIIQTTAGPKLQLAWRAPNPASPQARLWFRAPPTRPILQMIGSEPVIWIADNARDGHLIAIRARDGQIMADVTAGGWPMRNGKPVIYKNVLYLPAGVQGHDAFTWLEAYEITPRPGA